MLTYFNLLIKIPRGGQTILTQDTLGGGYYLCKNLTFPILKIILGLQPDP